MNGVWCVFGPPQLPSVTPSGTLPMWWWTTAQACPIVSACIQHYVVLLRATRLWLWLCLQTSVAPVVAWLSCTECKLVQLMFMPFLDTAQGGL